MRDDDAQRGQRTTSSAVPRRPLLGVLGSLGIAGALGLGAGTETGAARTQDEDADDEDWEAAAEDRIEEHRKADLEVRVVDVDGDEISGAEVDVTMQEHEYGFGTAVSANTLVNETEDGDEYREYIPELFNTAVLENYHKWQFFEEAQEDADEATEWLLDRGLDLRGHACLWSNVDANAVPGDVVEAMGQESEAVGATDPDEDADYVYERTTEHIEAIMDHYGDDITEWDVVNEAVHETGMMRTIDGDEAGPGQSPVLAEWYDIARELGEELDVGIDVNDYDVLVGPNHSTRRLYQDQIEFLLEEGIEIDGIGLQCHFSETSTLEPDQIMDGLDTYADYGADLRITEFDTERGSWDVEDRGEYLHTVMKTAFSHPATTDFVMWGFWDGRHWKDEAPLFHDDWEEKPGYEYYTNLVFDEWWTDETGETDGGVYETRAFKGEYEITASYGDSTETTTATLSDGGETVELQLDSEAGDEDLIPGLGVGSALAALAGVAGYALLRGRGEETS